MTGYVLHPQVEIHNASDKSGVLVYSGFSGTTIRLSEKLSPLVAYLQSHDIVTKQAAMQLLDEVEPDESQAIWETLLFNYILFPEAEL